MGQARVVRLRYTLPALADTDPASIEGSTAAAGRGRDTQRARQELQRRAGDDFEGDHMTTAITDTPMPERYFYHSFPRRGRADAGESQKGLKILELIRDFGLLLTPEITSWEHPHANQAPPRSMQMVQKRTCFTELSAKELPRHAEEFGHFALEFEVDTLKNLGALPVFYIPKWSVSSLASSLGQTLVIQMIDAMCLIDRIARVKQFIESTATGGSRQNFEFGFDKKKVFSLDISETQRGIEGVTFGMTPPEMLSNALEGVMNFFYSADADDSIINNSLKYYRQREWRIAGNLGMHDRELMGLPSEALIDRLLALDSDFFGRIFPPKGMTLTNPSLVNRAFGPRLIDWTYVYQGIDDRHIIGAASRVIVPRSAVDAARDILSKHPKPPPVVAIEDLA